MRGRVHFLTRLTNVSSYVQNEMMVGWQKILILAAVGVIVLFLLVYQGIISNPFKPKPQVRLNTQYLNPFEEESQYVNPFDEYKNPFDVIRANEGNE